MTKDKQNEFFEVEFISRGYRDISKCAIINLKKDPLEDLVSRLEKEAKEAIKRRIDSVYTDYLLETNPYDIRLPYILDEIDNLQKNILPSYKKASLTLNMEALEGLDFDSNRWKRLMADQGLNFVSTHQDVLVIDAFGSENYERLSNDVVEFIKSSATRYIKNGQYYYKINNKIYIL